MPRRLETLALRWRYETRKLLRPSSITLQGVKLAFPQNIGPELRKALYWEFYEKSELNALKKHLTQEDRVLDIGSSIGLVTISACQRIGSDRVVAIEANPGIAEYSRRNFAANNVSPTLFVGVADAEEQNERAEFFTYNDFWASSRLKRPDRPGEEKIQCESISVNALIAEYGINTIVCDIEGGEIALLSKLDMKAIDKLIIEFHPHLTSADDIRNAVMLILAAGLAPDIRASQESTMVFVRP